MRRLWVFALLSWLCGAGLAIAGDPIPAPATTDSPVLSVEECSGCDQGCGKQCWFTAETLLWWIKNHPVPTPLVSSSALNDPNNFNFLGGGDVDAGVRLGGRFTLGGWLNDQQTFGAEASYFFLGPHDDSDNVASTGTPELVVPRLILTPQGNLFGAFPLASPGLFADLSTLSIRTWLQGAEANALGNVASGSWGRLDVLGGFRYLQIDEELQLKSISPANDPNNLSLVSLDQFRCINNYYGGQLGLRAHVTRGRLFADCTAKVGLAHVQQRQTVSGQFRSIVGETDSTEQVGFFTGDGNTGTHTSDDLAWLGELTLNAGVNVTDSIRAFVGYNFLYVDEAQRPGEQISGRARSQGGNLIHEVRDQDAPFWAQGLNLGIEFRF